MDLSFGVALVALGLALLGAELHLSAAGALGVAGLAGLYTGSLLIVIGSGHGVVVALVIAAAIAIVLAASLALVGREAPRGRHA
jgi:membrane-bound ClpP family serine protease